jgi:hypothetical protein
MPLRYCQVAPQPLLVADNYDSFYHKLLKIK